MLFVNIVLCCVIFIFALGSLAEPENNRRKQYQSILLFSLATFCMYNFCMEVLTWL